MYDKVGFSLDSQMSTDAQAAIARLRNSGLLKSKGLVGGKWVDSYDGKTIEVQNPATGDVIANVPCMGKRETDDAISSAYDAFYCMNCDPLLIYSLDLNSCK